jgi:hypothetical protein
MSRSRLALAVVAVVVVAAGGIAAGLVSTRGPAAATTPTVTTLSPITAHEPTSTVASTRTTGTTVPRPTTTTRPRPATTLTPGGAAEPGRISDPAQAASHLFNAWQATDHDGALRFASAGAVRTLFAIDPYPRPRFSGCQPRDLGFDCRYGYPNANGILLLDLRVTGGASAGYRVVSVAAPLRFSDPASSAKHLLDSWRAGDRVAALGAASPKAVDAMFRLADRTHPPTPDGCSFVDPAHGYRCVDLVPGGRLELGVTGGASAGWVVTTVTKVTA